MSRIECPKCGGDISHTYEPRDAAIGIFTGGWYCANCDIPVNEGEFEEESRADYIIDRRKHDR